MTNKMINPASLYDSVKFGFSHAAVSRGGTTIECAGQVAWNAKAEVVGVGNLRAQTAQALANLKDVLAAAGATPADIVRLRTYVVDHNPDKLEPVLSEVGRFYAGASPAPNTFIGVQALALPDFLIEIEATAVID